jgi:hypothetical protein
MREWRYLERRRKLVLATALVAAVLLVLALLSPSRLDIVESEDGVASSGLTPRSSTPLSPLSSQPAAARAEKSAAKPDEGSGEHNLAAAANSSNTHNGTLADLPTESAHSPAPSSNAATVTEDDNQVEQPSDWCFYAWTAPPEHEAPPQEYFVSSDATVVWNGSRSVRLETTVPGFSLNVMWQAVDAAPYRNSRIRVSAHVRSTGYATQVFVRTLEASKPYLVLEGDRVPGFQPYNQWTGGTFDWTPTAVVLDVPSNADTLALGGVVYNGGALWLDDVRVDSADEETTPPQNRSLGLQPIVIVIDPVQTLDTPNNLDFELTSRGAAQCKASRLGGTG